MKKITAILGSAHNDFERQLKEVLNDLTDSVEILLQYQNDFGIKQYIESLKCQTCDTCKNPVSATTIDIISGEQKKFCNKCLLK